MSSRISFVLVGLALSLGVRAAEYRQSVGVGALQIFGVGVSASVGAASDPSTAAKTNREYDDGYNRVDSSGNLGEGAPGLASRTSNFGFINNTQVDLQRGTLSLHTVTPGESRYINRSSTRGDPGAEIHYRIVRDRERWRTFGLEARLGYVDLGYDSSETLTTTVRLLTDSYQLGGVVPQPAPYSGSFTVQPGTQRIGDTPTRSISTSSATLQGSRDLSAKGWLVRLGVVWLPWHSGRTELQVQAGPAAMNLRGSLRVNDHWLATGQPTYSVTADGARAKWLVGAYAGAALHVRLSDRWSAFGGVDFLTADTLAVHAGSAAARFTFSHAVLASLGVSYRF